MVPGRMVPGWMVPALPAAVNTPFREGTRRLGGSGNGFASWRRYCVAFESGCGPTRTVLWHRIVIAAACGGDFGHHPAAPPLASFGTDPPNLSTAWRTTARVRTVFERSGTLAG